MDNNMNSYNSGPGGGQGGPGGSGNGQGGPGGPGQGDPRKTSLILLAVAAVVTLLSMTFFMRMFNSATNQEIPYNEFKQMVIEGKVDSVTYDDTQIYIEPKSSQNKGILSTAPSMTYYTGKSVSDDTLEAFLEENFQAGRLKEYGKEVPDNSGYLISLLLTYILPIVLMWVLLSFLFKRMGGSGGPMGVGKSNAKVYVQKETGVTFRDVAGEDEAKESLQEVVDFLHNPQKYVKIGAKLPKGALLVGPPGTGKTLLAKAVAGEAKVPFFSLTGSDFIELYVGVGASRVRDLFKEATKNAPCIIFIDEIDAIGRSRDSKYGGGNEEREQTLNQLLSEMDGFDTSKGILVLGATNRPEILDKALLRPGRFDRRIIVDKPDLKGRVEILKVHAKDVKMDETVDFDAIALATSGAVGSDLANMINEAAINAVKEGREYVCQKDLYEAVEQVLVGKEKKDRIMSAQERRIVSYHEVGHALVAALQKNSEPVQKITIVPRTMGALGYVMHVPEEEKFLNTQAEIHDMLVGYLGGRAAEEIVFDTVTTGAANDIEQATSLARSMVTRFGMSKKFGLIGLESIESQYLDGRAVLNCSDATAAEIDQEVMKILKECYQEALELLSANRDVMDQLAAFLIEKETITGKEFMKIYREIKGIPEPEENAPGEAERAGTATGTKAGSLGAQASGGTAGQSVGAVQDAGSAGGASQAVGTAQGAGSAGGASQAAGAVQGAGSAGGASQAAGAAQGAGNATGQGEGTTQKPWEQYAAQQMSGGQNAQPPASQEKADQSGGQQRSAQPEKPRPRTIAGQVIDEKPKSRDEDFWSRGTQEDSFWSSGTQNTSTQGRTDGNTGRQAEDKKEDKDSWTPPTPGPEAQRRGPVGRFSGAPLEDEDKDKK